MKHFSLLARTLATASFLLCPLTYSDLPPLKAAPLVRPHRNAGRPPQKDGAGSNLTGSATNDGSSENAATGSSETLVKSIREGKGGNREESGTSPQVHQGGSKSAKGLGSAGNPSGRGAPNCETKHSIDTFIQITKAYAPQAAKGGGVYFLSDFRDVPQVFFLNQPQKWPRQVSFFPDGVAYYEVAPDAQRVILATHTGGNEQYNLHLLNTRTQELEPAVVSPEERVETAKWGANSKWFAYTSNRRNKVDFDLYRYDLATKKSTLLTELEGANYVADISDDGNLVALTKYRSITDTDVVLFDQAKKRLVPITKNLSLGAHRSPKFSKDGKHLFLLSDYKTDKSQLYALSLESLSEIELLSREVYEVENLQLDEKRQSLTYFINEEGYSRLKSFRVTPQGRLQSPLALPVTGQSVIEDLSYATSEQFFFAETSPSQSSDIWQWRGDKKVRWTESSHGNIDPSCFAKGNLVRYPSFDKLEIPGFLFLPSDYSSAKKAIPFILYVHGGPEAQYRPQFSKNFQYFLERGFGVFALNVRGSSGYGKTYVSLDNYQKRMDSVQDAVAGAKWLIQNGYTKPSQLAIYGGSYGGFMVLRTIQIAPQLFAAASESVGISDFVTFLKNTKPYRRALREAEYGPLSDEAFLKSISPMTYLDDIKTPLLIFHGANDPRVPVTEAEQMIAALTKRGVPVESKIFADEGHGNSKLRNIMEQATLMAYFFEKNFEKESAEKK